MIKKVNEKLQFTFAMRLFVFFIVLMSFCSCKKKLTQFNIQLDTEASIPANTAIHLPFSVQTPEIQSNTESQLANENSKAEYVKSMLLTELNLSIKSPSNKTFSFLNSIKVFLKAENLPEILLANKNDIPSSIGNVLSCDVTKEELKEYVRKQSLSLRVEAVTDELITEDVQIAIHSNFFVHAKLIK